MHLPGFLNPLTPFKNAITAVTTIAKSAEAVAATPLHMAKDQLSVYNDVLHLNFKQAAKDQVKQVAEPAATGKTVVGNQVGGLKTMLKNFF